MTQHTYNNTRVHLFDTGYRPLDCRRQSKSTDSKRGLFLCEVEREHIQLNSLRSNQVCLQGFSNLILVYETLK
jgi:hypothetical protein